MKERGVMSWVRGREREGEGEREREGGERGSPLATLALRGPWGAVLGFAVTGVVVVGAIGVLHTKAARPLLQLIGGCPMGSVSSEVVERGRLEAARTLRGSEPSPARYALGFELDRMTAAEVKVWADQHGVDCEEKRGGALLKCEAALGADEVSFGFNPAGKLVNLATVRYGLEQGDATLQWRSLAARLTERLGTPTHAASAESAHDYATSTIEYRYQDYVADLIRTNIPGRGVLVREHYMSALDGPI